MYSCFCLACTSNISHSVVIYLEQQHLSECVCYRLRFRREAQGSVFYNLFSCCKAFDTNDTGPGEKERDKGRKGGAAHKKY